MKNKLWIGIQILLSVITLCSFAFADEVSLLESDNDQANARIGLVQRANKEILLSTFIYASDRTGRLTTLLLQQARQKGVVVKVLLDAKGHTLTKADIKAMIDSGIEVKIYNQPKWYSVSSHNHRMHDKLLIIDGQEVLLGSRNVTDGFDVYKNIFHERDIVVRGAQANVAREYFLSLFNSAKVSAPKGTEKVSSSEQQNVQELINGTIKIYQAQMNTFYNCNWERWIRIADDKIRFVHDDFNQTGKLSNTAREHIRLFSSAQKEIIIENPYVILHKDIHEAFKQIRSKNKSLRIRVFTNSVHTNDEGLAQGGYEAFSDALDKLDFQVYELQEGYTLHAKSVVIDEKVSYVGSFNMDPRSQYLNTETGVIIEDEEFAKNLKEKIEDVEDDSLRVRNGKADGHNERTPGLSKEQKQHNEDRKVLSDYFKWLL